VSERKATASSLVGIEYAVEAESSLRLGPKVQAPLAGGSCDPEFSKQASLILSFSPDRVQP
jgi:hypothetical protein